MNNYYQYEDSRLLAAIKEQGPGSEYAFNEVYSRYSDKLYSYCLFKSDNEMDAQEVFQDTWLRFLDSVKKGRNVTAVNAWLYKTARNLSIDKYRQNRRKSPDAMNEYDMGLLTDPLNLHIRLENDELLSIIGLAVNNLSEIYKEAFLLVWFSGLNYSEIAEITGETTDCIKKRSYRAMEQVLAIMEPIINDIAK